MGRYKKERKRQTRMEQQFNRFCPCVHILWQQELRDDDSRDAVWDGKKSITRWKLMLVSHNWWKCCDNKRTGRVVFPVGDVLCGSYDVPNSKACMIGKILDPKGTLGHTLSINSAADSCLLPVFCGSFCHARRSRYRCLLRWDLFCSILA